MCAEVPHSIEVQRRHRPKLTCACYIRLLRAGCHSILRAHMQELSEAMAAAAECLRQCGPDAPNTADVLGYGLLHRYIVPVPTDGCPCQQCTVLLLYVMQSIQ